jgi:hypothetical protein
MTKTPKKKSVPLKLPTWRDVLRDFPAGYNAHRDQLADAWEHAESVNRLLAALQQAAEELEGKK